MMELRAARAYFYRILTAPACKCIQYSVLVPEGLNFGTPLPGSRSALAPGLGSCVLHTVGRALGRILIHRICKVKVITIFPI